MYEIKDLLKQILKDQEEIYSLVGEVLEVNEAKRVCKFKPLDGSAVIFNVRLQSSVSSEIGLVVFPAVGSSVMVSFLSKELAYISKTDQIEKILLNIGGFSLFVDNENLNTNVKNCILTTEETEVTAKNVNFTVETLFKLVSQQQIKMEAVNFILKSTNITIEGITQIIGATTITGAATITGGATVSGGMTVNGGSNGGVPLSAALVSELNEIKADLNQLKAVFNTWSPVANDGGAALKVTSTAWRSANVQDTIAADISNNDFTQ